MPEGIFENHHQAMLIEKKILLHQLSAVGGVLTITSDVLRTEQRWSLFKDRYQKKGITYFEIRDDFLTFEQSLRILQELPYEHFIFSFRKVSDFENIWSKEELIEILARVAWVDWPWELGPPDAILKHVPKGKIILSLPIFYFFRFGLHFLITHVGFYEKSNRRGVEERSQYEVENNRVSVKTAPSQSACFSKWELVISPQ